PSSTGRVTPTASATVYLPPHGRGVVPGGQPPDPPGPGSQVEHVDRVEGDRPSRGGAAGEGDLHHDGGPAFYPPNGPVLVLGVPTEPSWEVRQDAPAPVPAPRAGRDQSGLRPPCLRHRGPVLAVARADR